MDVRIGVTQTPKELEVELPDGTDRDEVVKQIEQPSPAIRRPVADRPEGPPGRRPRGQGGLRRDRRR